MRIFIGRNILYKIFVLIYIKYINIEKVIVQ